MKLDQLYHELKNLAEKLGISVCEQNFRPTGIPVKSGLCTVRGETRLLLDKHRPIRYRIDLLAEHLGEFSLEDVYIVPAVREYLDLNQSKSKSGSLSKSTPSSGFDTDPDFE